MGLTALRDQPVRDVIAKSRALAGRRMGWCQAIADLIEELAAQQRRPFGRRFAPRLCGTVPQLLLDPLPLPGVNDRGMLTLEDLALVTDSPGIDRVAQDLVDMSASKRVPP